MLVFTDELSAKATEAMDGRFTVSTDEVWGGDLGVTVVLPGDMFATFSPGESGPDTDGGDFGVWICGVYSDSCITPNDHTSRIPNTCRDIPRLVKWIVGIVASLVE